MIKKTGEELKEIQLEYLMRQDLYLKNINNTLTYILKELGKKNEDKR